MKTADGRRRGNGRAARRHLRHRAERRGDAPGRDRAARGQARGNAQHQDARRGARRWREAVAAEGHRPCPSGFDPRAAVARRWCGARPQAARLLAADAQEDGAARVALRALRPRVGVEDRRRRRLGDRRAEDQGRGQAARGDRPAHQGRARGRASSSCCSAPTRTPGSRCATSASACRSCCPKSSTPTTCSLNDWLVFSQPALETTIARLGNGTTSAAADTDDEGGDDE